MQLSREALHLVAQYVGTTSDLYSLSRVSREFQIAAEHTLYSTILAKDIHSTVALFEALSETVRIAALVVSLTLVVSKPNGAGGGYEKDVSQETESRDDPSADGFIMEHYWRSLSTALQHTRCLRVLRIHVETGNPTTAWILPNNNIFRLRSFHCDLAWDRELVAFLNRQSSLEDLYLADYETIPAANPADGYSGEGEERSKYGDLSQTQIHTVMHTFSGANVWSTDTPAGSQLSATNETFSVHPHALSRLTVFECSFLDAVSALAPGRPLRRIKSCFSHEDREGKDRELVHLLASLRLSDSGAHRIRSLDLSDTTYTEEFTLEFLRSVVPILPDLRYLGTLVLPIGQERLQFFGLLRRLRKLQAVELEISNWEPPPSPLAMRALASELRLYCPSVRSVVFFSDFERSMVCVVQGLFKVDNQTNLNNLWRDI